MGHIAEMTTWHFSFALELQDVDVDDAFDDFHSAGCDDALFSRRDDQEFVTFSRQAGTLEEAILSAIADLESVVGVAVTNISDRSLVTAEEIALRCGRSEESLHALIEQHRTANPFPSALGWIDDEPQKWEWSVVAKWFRRELGEYLRDPNAAMFAAIEDTLHARRSCGRLHPDQRRKISALLATD